MQPPDRKLKRVVDAARKAPPEPVPAVSADEIRFFARRTAAAWIKSRTQAPPSDALWLWERVATFASAVALVAMLLVVALPHPASEVNPFDPLGPDAAEDSGGAFP